MASKQGGTGGRMKNLSYEGSNFITDEDGYALVTLTGNYSSTPYVSATPGGADADNVIAYITSIESTSSGWQVVFRTSMGEQTVRYQAWGEIKETF
tara:strand:+ start:145 stop:432 length:288 start_codon:yes stop_codon:yes gene_type:complete